MLDRKIFILIYILCLSFLGFSQDTILLSFIDEDDFTSITGKGIITIIETNESFKASDPIIVKEFRDYNLTIKIQGYNSKNFFFNKENLNIKQEIPLQLKFNQIATAAKPTLHFKKEHLAIHGFPTLNDALANTTSIWMTRPNFMQNTLSIRGFTGNQNRIFFNDIPINTAMMGHWDNRSRDWLGLFPMSEIQEVGIVRMPNSSTLGGSISLETRMPDYYDGTNITGHGNFQLTTNGDRIVHGGVDFGRENFALTASLSRNSIGNIINGNSLEQSPSGFQQISGNIRGLVYLGRGELEFGYHGARNSGERVPLPNTMSNFFTPLFNEMSHQLAYTKFNYISRKGWFRIINIKGAYQNMSEQLVVTPYQAFENNEENGLHSGWLNITGTSNLGEGWKGFTTLEWRGDKVLTSSATFTDTLVGTTLDLLSRYPTDGGLSSFTFSHKQTLKLSRMRFNAGIEGNLTTLSGTTNIDTFMVQPFSFSAYGQSNIAFRSNQMLVIHVSYNYRPLSFEDMPYLGDQLIWSGNVITINEDLRPENSLHFELGYRVHSNSLRSRLGIYLFRSQLYNGIQTVLRTPTPSSPRLTYDNTIQGYIQGVEGEFDTEIGYDFHLKGNISYLNGQFTFPNQNTRFNSNIPPVFGSLSLHYLNDLKISSALQLQFAGATTNISDSDPLYTFIDEGLNGGWQVLNWSVGYEYNIIKFNAGIRNIFDAEYYRFGSYIQDYGRTFWVGLQVNPS